MAASGTPSPSLRHRRLTREVRRLREESGLTRDEAAAAMEWKPSKVTRIETGRWTRLQPRDLRDMCGAYGVEWTDIPRISK